MPENTKNASDTIGKLREIEKGLDAYREVLESKNKRNATMEL